MTYHSEPERRLLFDLSRSVKLKSNGAVGVAIYDVLFVFNSNA